MLDELRLLRPDLADELEDRARSVVISKVLNHFVRQGVAFSPRTWGEAAAALHQTPDVAALVRLTMQLADGWGVPSPLGDPHAPRFARPGGRR